MLMEEYEKFKSVLNLNLIFDGDIKFCDNKDSFDMRRVNIKFAISYLKSQKLFYKKFQDAIMGCLNLLEKICDDYSKRESTIDAEPIVNFIDGNLKDILKITDDYCKKFGNSDFDAENKSKILKIEIDEELVEHLKIVDDYTEGLEIKDINLAKAIESAEALLKEISETTQYFDIGGTEYSKRVVEICNSLVDFALMKLRCDNDKGSEFKLKHLLENGNFYNVIDVLNCIRYFINVSFENYCFDLAFEDIIIECGVISDFPKIVSQDNFFDAEMLYFSAADVVESMLKEFRISQRISFCELMATRMILKGIRDKMYNLNRKTIDEE